MDKWNEEKRKHISALKWKRKFEQYAIYFVVLKYQLQSSIFHTKRLNFYDACYFILVLSFFSKWHYRHFIQASSREVIFVIY